MPTTPERSVEVCILGAGPHGLAAAVHLRRARPDLRLAVVDPAGAWLAGWHEQFARAQIETLRSPIVHHPAPNPYELSDYVTRSDYRRSGLPYDPPTTAAFGAFCAELVERTDLAPPLATRAEAVRRDGHGLWIETEHGDIRADHLVMATNPHRRTIPEWVWPLLGQQPGLFVFGGDVDLRPLGDAVGERVVIIGGGLTAAHLALGAADRGLEVHLVSRRPLETRNFDTAPGWLGPKYLTAYAEDEDPESRLATAVAARGGGSIPPWMRERLDTLIEDGRLQTHEHRDIRASAVDDGGSAVLALDDQRTLEADRVWLATGTTPSLDAARCLGDLVADVPSLDGLPITDDRLRLGPHPIHVMGRLATLTLGPAAGNLWGAQRAATRITEAITGINVEHGAIVHRVGHGRR